MEPTCVPHSNDARSTSSARDWRGGKVSACSLRATCSTPCGSASLGRPASASPRRPGCRPGPPLEGEHVAGIYRQRVTLASGRFAMIDDGFGFCLVPWTPALERHLGRQVAGVADCAGVDWSFGRKRGLGIG